MPTLIMRSACWPASAGSSANVSRQTLKANANERYTTFAKELGDGMMMIWIAEQGSITDIAVEEITGLAFASQEIVKRFFELSADFAPEKYHVGIGIAIGSFQRLLYRRQNESHALPLSRLYGRHDQSSRTAGRPVPAQRRYRVLQRPAIKQKKEIIACISGQDFKEATHDIRGLGKTPLFQWKLNLRGTGEQRSRCCGKTGLRARAGRRAFMRRSSHLFQ